MPGKISWKTRLTNFVERGEERRTGGAPEAASFHIRGYHRYFEGYTEVPRLQPDGRRRIERVYTGVYRRQELAGARRLLLRAAYVLLWLLSAGCFLLFAAQDVGSNRMWYVTAAELLCVLMGAAAAAPALLTRAIERRVPYREFRSGHDAPENSVEIT